MVKREVVFVCGKDPVRVRGGHPMIVRAHGRAAMAAGFTPHLFCASAASDEVSTEFGVLHRVATHWRSYRQTMVPFLAPCLTEEIVRFLSGKEGPHLVHSFSTWATVGIAVQRKLRRIGQETIPIASAYTTMAHESWGKIRGLNSSYSLGQHISAWAEYLWVKAALVRRERNAYQQSRLILINYDSVQRIIGAAHGSGLSFRKMVYTSESAFRSDIESESELPAPEPLRRLEGRRGPLIVAVSRHDLRKGLDVLLRSLAKLREADVEFRACLVGPGVLLDQHRRLASKLNLAESTVITGDVSDPLPYLAQADIFVLPSIEEGSGSLSLLEALQTRNACVVSNCDGLVEDVTDGHDALLVPPGDEASLTAALRRLIGDDGLRRRLSDAARETFERRFSAAALTRELGSLYRELTTTAD